MSIPLTILTAVKPYFPERGLVLDYPVPINGTEWERVGERAGDLEVAKVLDSFPGKITRNDIVGLRHEDSGVRRRRVAITSLMWGYGITGARWKERWVSAVSGFLRSSGLNDVLACCEEHLGRGEVAEAYKLFTNAGEDARIEVEKYYGIGAAFFTKILYFLARNAQQDSSARYPLILDTRVSMALSWMTGYRLLARPASYRPRPDSGAYARYVERMHAWAGELDVAAEVIEYYLWAEARESASQLWAECEKQHGGDFP